jgi:Cu/Ag efflux pump CusA
VEELVTLNVEELLSGVPWLSTIRSRSVPGMSSVVMIFEPGTDLMRARQMVQERLTLAYALPNVSKPPNMLQPLSATSRVMMVGLTSSKLSLIEMSVLARWTIKPKLLGVPGVANVAIWGHRDRQLQVQIDPERLRAHGVSQDQIIETTGNALWISPLTFLEASFPGAGGWIDGPQQRLEVRHVLPISAPEDLARMTIEGTSLRLADVADVLNESPGLLLVVQKLPGVSTLEVTKGLEAAIASLRPGMVDVNMDTTIFRSASFIELAFANLTTIAVMAIVLVILILGALFYNWRTSLIGLVVILLSLFATVFVFEGGTLNTMVLAGLVIALAAVVDDAIIGVENMVRRLRQRGQERNEKSTIRTIVEATLEMRGAMLYATVVVLLVVVPMFLMEGVGGAFFRPLALSFALAVVVSMVVAMTVTPTLGLFLLRGAPLENRESPLVGWLRRRYDNVLSRVTQKPGTGFVAAGLVVLAGVAAWPFLGQSLIPSFKERYLRIDWVGAPGTSHPAMMRILSNASGELRSIPGVSDAHLQVGRAVTGDQIVNVNASQLWVSIDPDADYDATVAAIKETVNGYPGLDHNVQSYLTDRIREVLAGAPQPIVVRVYGKERSVLQAQAEEVRGALAGIDGLADLQVEGQIEEPHVEIELDLERAEPYPTDSSRGISAGRPPRSLRGSTSGSSSRNRKCTMWWCGARPRNATACPIFAIFSSRRPVAVTCGSGMWPTCASRLLPPRYTMMPSRLASTFSPTYGAVTTPLSRARSSVVSTRWTSRSSITRCCWESMPSGRRRRTACSVWSSPLRSGCSSCCRRHSEAGAWLRCSSCPSPWRWPVVCWRRCSMVACSPWVRSLDSLGCSRSPCATAKASRSVPISLPGECGNGLHRS